MFANSQMSGLDTGFPDVCLTPSPAGPVPIPYPNLAPGPTTVPSQVLVFYMYTPAHNMTSTEPMTQGDNAGVAMGVASGTVMAPRRHMTASFTVLVGGAPATKLTSVAVQNNTNCPGVRAVPSQIKVLLLAP
jgi:hypothetical protein